MPFCPNCGSQVSNDDTFCGTCAHPLKSSNTAEATATYTPTYEAAPAEKKKEFNVMALLGLIFGYAVDPILGLIFSIIGLKKAKEIGGRWLAIPGLCVSIYTLVTLVSVFTFLGIYFVVYILIMVLVFSTTTPMAMAAVALI